MGKLFTLLLVLMLVVYYKGTASVIGAFSRASVALGYMLTGRDPQGQFVNYADQGPSPGPPPAPPTGPPARGAGIGPVATSLTLYNQPGFQGASAKVQGDQHYIAVGTLFGASSSSNPDVRSIQPEPAGSCYTLYEGINYTMGSVPVCGDVSDTWAVIPWHQTDTQRTVSSIKLSGSSLAVNQPPSSGGPPQGYVSPGGYVPPGGGSSTTCAPGNFDCIRTQCARGDQACANRVAPWATNIPMSSYGWS